MRFVPTIPPITAVAEPDDVRPVHPAPAVKPITEGPQRGWEGTANEAARESSETRSLEDRTVRGEDRRKGDRRVAQVPVLLDTRSKTDRRKQNRRRTDRSARSIDIEA